MERDYLAEAAAVCQTDGDFFAYMKAEERKILEEIDPEAIPLLDEEERIAQEEYEAELAAEEV